MSWLLLALLSAVSLGLYDVSRKAALNGNAVLAVLLLASVSGLGLLSLELALAPSLAQFGVRAELVPLGGAEHVLVLAKAALVSTSWVFSFFAIKHLPLSIASPIRAGAPVFTVLGALLLFQERPEARQWLGVSVVFVAYFVFSLIGHSEGIRFGRDRWVAALFVGTLLGAGSALYDKYLLQMAELPPFTLQFWFTLYSALLQGLLLVTLHTTGVSRDRLELRWTIPALGWLLVVADQFYFQALATTGALVSIVSVVRRSNVVVSFPLGGLLFREHHLRAKALALTGVLLGLWFLYES